MLLRSIDWRLVCLRGLCVASMLGPPQVAWADPRLEAAFDAMARYEPDTVAYRRHQTLRQSVRLLGVPLPLGSRGRGGEGLIDFDPSRPPAQRVTAPQGWRLMETDRRDIALGARPGFQAFAYLRERPWRLVRANAGRAVYQCDPATAGEDCAIVVDVRDPKHPYIRAVVEISEVPRRVRRKMVVVFGRAGEAKVPMLVSYDQEVLTWNSGLRIRQTQSAAYSRYRVVRRRASN